MNEPHGTDGTPQGERWQLDDIAPGTTVDGCDGQIFGEVAAVYRHYLIIERGFFFPKDYFVPLDAVNDYDGDRVYLRVTTELALNQGWDNPPDDALDAVSDRRSARADMTERAEQPEARRVPNGALNADALLYPDTYAVGTNTDSYGAIMPMHEPDEPSATSQ
jgi:hypothetical protein